MDIERRCNWCGKPFIAHNFGTRYCSPSCRRDAKRSNAKKVNAVEGTTKCQVPEIGLIGNKPFLSPKDVAILLGTTSAGIAVSATIDADVVVAKSTNLHAPAAGTVAFLSKLLEVKAE